MECEETPRQTQWWETRKVSRSCLRKHDVHVKESPGSEVWRPAPMVFEKMHKVCDWWGEKSGHNNNWFLRSRRTFAASRTPPPKLEREWKVRVVAEAEAICSESRRTKRAATKSHVSTENSSNGGVCRGFASAVGFPKQTQSAMPKGFSICSDLHRWNKRHSYRAVKWPLLLSKADSSAAFLGGLLGHPYFPSFNHRRAIKDMDALI